MTTLGAGLLAALGWVGMEMLHRKTRSLLAHTNVANDALLEIRADVQGLQNLVESADRARADARSRLAYLREADAPDAGDVATNLQHELDIARAEQVTATAETLWQYLAPRVDENNAPEGLRVQLAALENALRMRRFADFAAIAADIEETIRREKAIHADLQTCARARMALADLAREMEYSRPATPDSEYPEGEWSVAAASALAAAERSRKVLQTRSEVLTDRYSTARAEWDGLFPRLGAPSVEFLGHPAAKAEAARAFSEIDRFDRAIPLIREALERVLSWTADVRSLNERCREPWEKARREGRAFENALGMRFVQGPGLDHHRSIWETRVMDFARFAAADNGYGSEAGGTFWMDPGFPIGPTHPVVGVPPEAARAFAGWLRKAVDGTTSNHLEFGVPNRVDYERLDRVHGIWKDTEIKYALVPEVAELRSHRWRSQLAELQLDPSRHIRPVGTDRPQAGGLFDLGVNVWEWTLETTTFPNLNVIGSRGDHACFVLFGGGSFGEISFLGHDRPTEETIFVGRAEAIGFRVHVESLSVREVLEKYGESAPNDGAQ